MGAAEVLGPHARGEAVIAVVRVADYFVFAVEWRDRNNGTENFFAVSSAGDWQVGEDCRRKKVAVAATVVDCVRRVAAECDLAAFFLREVDVELHFIELRLAHDGALLGFFFQWIALF